jgi:FKBP-type peptidyl-prolyl cis-trans isomerase FkpA
MRTLLFIMGVFVMTSSCKTYSDDDLKVFDKEIEAYIKSKNLELERSESGLYFTIIEEGEGDEILYSNNVSFTYKGTLLNGDVFDEQNEPVTFKVNQLIGAWKEIMLDLKKGGKAFLITPPQLGYGDRELDKIPANSILVFEMEVTDVN